MKIPTYNVFNKYNLSILFILFIINVVLLYNKYAFISEQDKTTYINTLKLFINDFNVKWIYLVILILLLLLLIKRIIEIFFIKCKNTIECYDLLRLILIILFQIIYLSLTCYLYFFLLYSIYYLNNIVVTQKNNIIMN